MDEQTEIKKYSELYPEQPQFEAEHVKFEDILGKDIVLSLIHI